MTEFTKFPSIDSFAHAWKALQRARVPSVTYGAKIKLRGTNGGIRVSPDGTVTAQSRTRDITPMSDNAGFAFWVETTKDSWVGHVHFDEGDGDVIYFGEWAGKGIQKNDAVTKLNGKYFFIFAVQVGDTMLTEPETIEMITPDLDNVLVLPWFDDYVELTVGNTTEANAWAEKLNAQVEEIGACDPFMKEVFGIEGIGAGLVLMPAGAPDRDFYSAATFKAKSEAHRVKKSDKAVKTRIEVPASATDFATDFVTPARCEQALTEACDGIAERSRTGSFLKWIGQDILKEGVEELAGLGLEWKQVAGPVNKAAVAWFMDKCNQLAPAE